MKLNSYKRRRAGFWDYRRDGCYHVIIKTKFNVNWFGSVENDVMVLNEMGLTADSNWKLIGSIFPFVTLGAFQIMPNHIHGVLHIKCSTNHSEDSLGQSANTLSGGITSENNPMIDESLGTIIRWFKGKTCHELRKRQPKFGWQPQYYDNIILSLEELKSVEQYIYDNPKNWNS